MTDAIPSKFVIRLEEWRRQLGMGHTEFARKKLGLSRQMWQFLRAGKYGVSLKLAGRVMKEKPELAYFLAAEASARTKTEAAA